MTETKKACMTREIKNGFRSYINIVYAIVKAIPASPYLAPTLVPFLAVFATVYIMSGGQISYSAALVITLAIGMVIAMFAAPIQFAALELYDGKYENQPENQILIDVLDAYKLTLEFSLGILYVIIVISPTIITVIGSGLVVYMYITENPAVVLVTGVVCGAVMGVLNYATVKCWGK